MIKKIVLVVFFSIFIGVFVAFNYLLIQKENSDTSTRELERQMTAQSATIINQADRIGDLENKASGLTEQIETLREQSDAKEVTIATLEKDTRENGDLLTKREDLINKLKQGLDVEQVGKQAREWVEYINSRDYEKAYARFNKAIDNVYTSMILSEFRDYYARHFGMVDIKSLEVMTRGIPENIDNDLIIAVVVDVVTPRTMELFQASLDERRVIAEAEAEAAKIAADAAAAAAAEEEARLAAIAAAEKEAEEAASAINGEEDAESGLDGASKAAGGVTPAGPDYGAPDRAVDGDGENPAGATGGEAPPQKTDDVFTATGPDTGETLKEAVNGEPADGAVNGGGENQAGAVNSGVTPTVPDDGAAPTGSNNNGAPNDSENGGAQAGAENGGTQAGAENGGAHAGPDGNPAEGVSINGNVGAEEEPEPDPDPDPFDIASYTSAAQILEAMAEYEYVYSDELDKSNFNNGENQFFFLMNYKKEANDWEIVRVVQKL